MSRLSRETARRAEARRLDARILAAVARGWEDPLSEEEFDALASDLFAHQARHNPTARAWWREAGPRGGSLRGWRDVPPLPVAAYRRARVAAFPTAAGSPAAGTPAGDGGSPAAGSSRTAGATDRPRFLSSGTTDPARSRVFVEGLELYEAALLRSFRRHALSDLPRMRLLFLAPAPAHAPQSSLSHMFAVLRVELGAPGSAFLDDAGALRMGELCSALEAAGAQGEPVFLLGPVFAFVHALDFLRARGARFGLPADSRVFQTGGFKGRSRRAEPEELEEGYAELFDVPRERIVNEYGMAELASQFYAGPDGRYAAPPWVRWRVLDPLTLTPAPPAAPGLLAVWDLANRSNCFALRTEDLAVAGGDRFSLLGRLAEAEPRGCSLEADVRLQPVTASARGEELPRASAS
jgi:hypothetical protein